MRVRVESVSLDEPLRDAASEAPRIKAIATRTLSKSPSAGLKLASNNADDFAVETDESWLPATCRRM